MGLVEAISMLHVQAPENHVSLAGPLLVSLPLQSGRALHLVQCDIAVLALALLQDAAEHSRVPARLTVGFRHGYTAPASRSVPMPGKVQHVLLLAARASASAGNGTAGASGQPAVSGRGSAEEQSSQQAAGAHQNAADIADVGHAAACAASSAERAGSPSAADAATSVPAPTGGRVGSAAQAGLYAAGACQDSAGGAASVAASVPAAIRNSVGREESARHGAASPSLAAAASGRVAVEEQAGLGALGPSLPAAADGSVSAEQHLDREAGTSSPAPDEVGAANGASFAGGASSMAGSSCEAAPQESLSGAERAPEGGSAGLEVTAGDSQGETCFNSMLFCCVSLPFCSRYK